MEALAWLKSLSHQQVSCSSRLAALAPRFLGRRRKAGILQVFHKQASSKMLIAVGSASITLTCSSDQILTRCASRLL